MVCVSNHMYEECIATGKPVSAMAPGDNNESQRKEPEREEGPNCSTRGLETAVSQQQCLTPFHMGQKKMKDSATTFSFRKNPDNKENKQEERKQMSFYHSQ